MRTILQGLPASPGKVEGIARVILPSDELTVFEEGEILVTTITDPTMVTAMVKAAAIVTDIGGMTSHPAILSREMGIPCVVAAKEATEKIKTGTKIYVDGTTGTVSVD